MTKHNQSSIAQGLRYLMNNPQTCPTSPDGQRVFKEMIKASGMPVSEVLKHVGKKSKAPRPTDDERSKQRIEKLEQE